MKKITEQEAASLFTLYLTQKARDVWPVVKKDLEDASKEKFTITEEDMMMASYDLALAAMAQDLQALENLFPKDQSERLRKWVFKHLGNMEDWGEYAIQEVTRYSKAFQKCLNNIERYGNPINVIPTLLLYKWLGANIDNIEVKLNGKRTGFFDPIIVGMVTHTLVVQFAGTWKKAVITKDVELVEGDMPLDENLDGLKDYTPESDNERPEGTIRYRDNNGELKEKWLPPEKIDELLRAGSAKRIFKVLIKGPWDRIKEAWWELSDDTIRKFVDEKNYAYVVAYYEKGELKYILTKKKIWEQMDEVGKILMNQNSSPEQQIENIKKLASD